MNNNSKQKVGVAGFRGYSGAELLRYLARHPQVEPVLLDHRQEDLNAVPCTPDAVRKHELALVFLATPHEVSMELAPLLLEAGAKVVDLSGAFRLKTTEAHQRWYGAAHTSPELLNDARYGLPEFYRSQITKARFVANPGCYPTAANLALRPLVQAGVIDLQCGIVCDAKSGVSGAGRKASLTTSFCEVAGNFSAYSVLDHRHVPEILMNSCLDEASLSFTAQLIPVERGILETIYFRCKDLTTAGDLTAIYERSYAREPFVRVHAPGAAPDLKAVNYTNRCHLGAFLDGKTGRAVVVSAIDNLGKGAAGQAIQNMNLMLGFPETESLL